jgi:hypothetical protein
VANLLLKLDLVLAPDNGTRQHAVRVGTWDLADAFNDHRKAMLRLGPLIRRLLPPGVRESLGEQLQARLGAALPALALSNPAEPPPEDQFSG